LEVAAVQTLPQPSAKAVKDLKDWLSDPKGGDTFLRICDATEARVWDKTEDLVTVANAAKKDLFSSFFSTKIVQAYHYVWGEKHHVSRL
jgi:hypothetical protein